jgi:YMGG-like Gly-zipper
MSRWFQLMLGAFALTGCVTAPIGPRVTTLPGTGKSFEQFRADEGSCRNYASDSIGGQAAAQTSIDNAVGSAVLGTAIGAVAGAALGGNQGAAVGAGFGLFAGSAIGADQAQASAYGAQRRYDQAYVQCMYGKGHRVPVSARYVSGRDPTYYRPRPAASYPPPPPGYSPPPPHGYPPPPPPGVPPPPPPDYAPPPPAPAAPSG